MMLIKIANEIGVNPFLFAIVIVCEWDDTDSWNDTEPWKEC